MASPSTMHDFVGKLRMLSTIRGYRSVKSCPLVAFLPCDDPKAIVFDFVNPARTARWLFGRARQARLKIDRALYAPLE
jgi:hypothetical protein